MFGKVEEALRDAKWNYRVKNDTIQLSVDTDDGVFYMDVKLGNNDKSLGIVAHFDIECPVKYRPEICKMMAVANKNLEIGSVQMEYDSGVMSYKSYVLLLGVTLSPEFMNTFIHDTIRRANALRFSVEAVCRGEKCENVLFID